MAETFLQTIPILRMFDAAKAKEFYVEFLGFTIDWEHRFEPELPLYMQISRGNLVLHLSEHYGDGTPGSAVFVRMQGVEEYHRELAAKRYNYYRPCVETTPWNSRSMDVVDPFGNRLSFDEKIQAN